MSHGRIFEIRAAKRFDDDELQYGTMNDCQVFDNHQDLFDSLTADPAFVTIDRTDDIKSMLMPYISEVFTLDADCLTLSQSRYDAYVEQTVKAVSEAALKLTPQGFYDSSQYRTLQNLLPALSYEPAYVYDEQEGDIISCREFILKSSSYRSPDGDRRRFYIGKVWDFHC